jgi:hypothetical protein
MGYASDPAQAQKSLRRVAPDKIASRGCAIMREEILSVLFAVIFGLIVFAILALFYYSLGRILYRMGFSPAWLLLIGFWPILVPILAHMRWPIEDRLQRKETAPT